jgi:hypothetical protein
VVRGGMQTVWDPYEISLHKRCPLLKEVKGEFIALFYFSIYLKDFHHEELGILFGFVLRPGLTK